MKFFDLDENATMRDLDNAPETYHKQTIQLLQLRRFLASISRYRKLAKKMHPDKNGGTDEAKQRLRSRDHAILGLDSYHAYDRYQDTNLHFLTLLVFYFL